MAIVAFPANYRLERTSKIARTTGVVVDIMDDGAPRVREVSASTKYTRIQCEIKYLTLTEFTTLATFIETNAANDITWTIDGYNYQGVFEGGYQYDMTGISYSVSFVYYARRV